MQKEKVLPSLHDRMIASANRNEFARRIVRRAAWHLCDLYGKDASNAAAFLLGLIYLTP